MAKSLFSRDCRTVDWFGQKDPVYAYVNQKSCEESWLRKKKRQQKSATLPTSSHDFRCHAPAPICSGHAHGPHGSNGSNGSHGPASHAGTQCPWAQRKSSPEKHGFSHEIWGVPVNVPSNHPIDQKIGRYSWDIWTWIWICIRIYIYIYVLCNIMGVVVATRLRFLVLPPWKELFVFYFLLNRMSWYEKQSPWTCTMQVSPC